MLDTDRQSCPDLLLRAHGEAARFLSLEAFDIALAVRSVTIKLVGYTETVRVLHPRFRLGASVVLFGGLAKERPDPGSTIVTGFNGGVTGLIKTLAVEIAPHRVNALHPGVVGDSPKWISVHMGRAYFLAVSRRNRLLIPSLLALRSDGVYCEWATVR